jgi:hypothetical protein
MSFRVFAAVYLFLNNEDAAEQLTVGVFVTFEDDTSLPLHICGYNEDAMASNNVNMTFHKISIADGSVIVDLAHK